MGIEGIKLFAINIKIIGSLLLDSHQAAELSKAPLYESTSRLQK